MNHVFGGYDFNGAQPAGLGTPPQPGGWAGRYVRGVMGANVSERIDDIHDGASNTILVGEIRAGVISFDPRGVWAMGGAAPSSLWAHGYQGDDNGPNNKGSPAADDMQSCGAIQTAIGGSQGTGSAGEQQLMKMGMACGVVGARTCRTGSKRLAACTWGASMSASRMAASISSAISSNWEHCPAGHRPMGTWACGTSSTSRTIVSLSTRANFKRLAAIFAMHAGWPAPHPIFRIGARK